MISSKFIIKIVDKLNKYIVLFMILIIYCVAYYFRMMHIIHTDFYLFNILINALVLYGTSLLMFVIGIMFKKYNLISCIRNYIRKHSTFIAILIIIMSIVIHIIIKSMVIAPFTALLFIIGYVLLDIKGMMKTILLFFGNHSTNIWLVHMQFYSIFFKDIVFCTNTVLGCLIILLIMCFITSYVINMIHNMLSKSQINM